ncbi:hypothetical protein CBS470a_007862 [Colletotrichum nupharicola]|nr:hypothetical protein CBS470a_007862 [Colletotrichum nupharicola]
MVGKGEGVFDSSPPPYQQHHAPRLFVVRRRRGRLLAFTVLVVVLISLSHYYNAAIQDPVITEELRKVLVTGLETCRETVSRHQRTGDVVQRESNPRWNKVSGQKQAIILRNATLFDGDVVLPDAVDILFEKGLIKSVETTREEGDFPSDAVFYNLNRRLVTPGLVDIHSHHLELPFSSVSATADVNEKPQLGPITPFVRAIDGFKPYDPAIKIIASGGVTTSLILPGSGNIIGGQGYLVKNLPSSGENGEPIVEDLLLEHGIPEEGRQRYLKMACGENPKHLYGHTRLGNAWLLRQHLEKARKLKSEQDAWCRTAEHVEAEGFKHVRIARFVAEYGGFPEDLELEATVALLRGEFNVNIHCYEPEDFERMLAVLHEFGVHPQAFHHALEAWQVPEFLKEQEREALIDDVSSLDTSDHLAMVVTNGEITCLGAQSACVSSYEGDSIVSIKLDNGYITPGLVAFGNNIGILDISSEPSTGDGSPGRKGNALKERKDLHFAKYGVHFGGRGFGRARLGGVTKAVTAPIFGGGLLQGVSVGLWTAENATLIGDGIWKDEVALHVAIGQEAKAEAKIPVILTGNRGAPDKWEKKNSFAGPPLSPSPAQVLIDAGVLVALAVRGDSKVHGLAQEAQWAAKFAGLSEKEAIKLVSTNFNKILGLEKYRKGDSPAGNKYSRDFVVWEGNPLRGEGSVVLSVQDDGKIGDCWPDYEGAVL